MNEYTTAGVPIATPLISNVLPTAITVDGSDVYVANYTPTNAHIGKYTSAGVVVNPTLITQPPLPPIPNPYVVLSLAVSGTNIYVPFETTAGESVVAEYTTSGTPVNTSLISGLTIPSGIAISGDNLFLANAPHNVGSISEYTSSGTPINLSLITGIDPFGVLVSGQDLFVLNYIADPSGRYGTVGEYTTAGVPINPNFISLPGNSLGFALDGNDLFVANQTRFGAQISEYTTSGELISSFDINPVNHLYFGGIAIVPEPGATWLLLVPASGFLMRRRKVRFGFEHF